MDKFIDLFLDAPDLIHPEWNDKDTWIAEQEGYVLRVRHGERLFLVHFLFDEYEVEEVI